MNRMEQIALQREKFAADRSYQKTEISLTQSWVDATYLYWKKDLQRRPFANKEALLETDSQEIKDELAEYLAEMLHFRESGVNNFPRPTKEFVSPNDQVIWVLSGAGYLHQLEKRDQPDAYTNRPFGYGQGRDRLHYAAMCARKIEEAMPENEYPYVVFNGRPDENDDVERFYSEGNRTVVPRNRLHLIYGNAEIPSITKTIHQIPTFSLHPDQITAIYERLHNGEEINLLPIANDGHMSRTLRMLNHVVQTQPEADISKLLNRGMGIHLGIVPTPGTNQEVKGYLTQEASALINYHRLAHLATRKPYPAILTP